MTNETRELTALAERVEAATGADRELDSAINAAIKGFDPKSPYGVARFTASLDAAITLALEGWGWSFRDTGYARLISPKRQPDDCEGFAATSALAFCAAALRARALSGTGESR